MIDIKKLTVSDIGRWVEYRPDYGDPERGKIKSYNDVTIFVVYHTGGNWRGNDWRNYTGASTRPADLVFIDITDEEGSR